MADDFLLNNAEKRLQAVRAAKQRTIADLSEAQAEGNDYSAQEHLGTLAHLELEERGLVQMAHDYIAAKTPQAPPPQTEGEWMAKDSSKMNYGDVYQIMAKSKYGPPDPNQFQASVNEFIRRKRGGEFT